VYQQAGTPTTIETGVSASRGTSNNEDASGSNESATLKKFRLLKFMSYSAI
jgi:hypothetical protein